MEGDGPRREDIGRDQVARLMRQLGIEGVNRSKRVRTTRADGQAARHPDLVDRQFIADRPNALWVTDLTYVPTWSGVAYVCFIIDANSRMIVGWPGAPNMRTEMVLDAIEMARWSRGTTLEGLVLAECWFGCPTCLRCEMAATAPVDLDLQGRLVATLTPLRLVVAARSREERIAAPAGWLRRSARPRAQADSARAQP